MTKCSVCGFDNKRGVWFADISPFGVSFNEETKKRLSWLKSSVPLGWKKRFVCELCASASYLWFNFRIPTIDGKQTPLSLFLSEITEI